MIDLAALGIPFLGSVIATIVYSINYGALVIFVEILLQIVVYAILGFFLFKFKKISDICEINLIEYHDFLIGYRQTPRSKILKKHLPELSAIVEEQSMYEQSQLYRSHQ